VLIGPRDTSRDRWFDDTAVKAIVDAILRIHDPRLVRWAKESTLHDTRGEVATEFRLVTDRDLRRAANQIATAGAKICAKSSAERSHLVGALVERLAYALVSRRASAERERRVGLSGTMTSNYLEVVVDEDPFEAYECKYSPGRLDQGDLDQLGSVRDAARRNGRAGIVGVVTLDSWRALQAAVASLLIAHDIRHTCATDFLELGDAPAARQLSKNMAATHPRT
jgi:hypothetical protein